MRSRIVAVTIATWAVIALLYEGARIWVVLNGPPPSEWYADSFSFQFMASLYLLMILWIPILAAVLFLEMLVFAAADRGRLRLALALVSVLLMAAALYSALWIISSSSLAFAACGDSYSLFAESFRCRQPYVATILTVFFFAACIGCMWARSRAKTVDG